MQLYTIKNPHIRLNFLEAGKTLASYSEDGYSICIETYPWDERSVNVIAKDLDQVLDVKLMELNSDNVDLYEAAKELFTQTFLNEETES